MTSRTYMLLFSVLCCVAGQNVWAQSLDLEDIAQAVAEYESLFEDTDLASDPALEVELRRLMPLLPESILPTVVESDSIKTTLSARSSILGWWRSQDPLPASEVNERMVEHVRRVQYALDHYGCTSCEEGYDERGEIYVRYGEPERISRVTFDDPLLIDAIYQPGIAVSPADFPDNEFWRYLNLDRDAYFLFIQDGGFYRIGDTSDLLPSVLRSGLGYSGRGLVKSRMLLAAMRSIYRQLALEHHHFGSRFNDVDLWLAAREETGRLRGRDNVENSKIITGAALVQGETPEQLDLDQELRQPPILFAQNTILSARTQDQQAAYQREILLPSSTSEVLNALPTFALGVRHARFLKPDGTTTTEIYWHPESTSFTVPGHPAQEEYIIKSFVAQEDAAHTRLNTMTDAIRVEMPSASEAVTIPVQTIEVNGSTGLYHLALQWDQHEVTPAGIGNRLQLASRRIDSLRALDASGATLEMSDLIPLAHNIDTDELVPWPHEWIYKGMRFGLGFEIYHLAYGQGDQTSYKVTYQVSSGRRRISSTSVEFEGQSRLETEEVYLDLGQRAGEIIVTVSVQDQISGQEISRSLTLTLFDDQG
ncbi:MAG: GWxTD domain-containing protein [Rhodothermaceae bacterium]|nr:GWxTD domain-containing protein [Rhodothermaceae bacterium]MXZ57226.1 GWxTD domain-containing protein [Rhodothermaceae bacterium]MYB90923.1 GWxTD domain-containing protein [Rhodothermaceae bacterium]MYD67798.1 GWxTD domain-containing protein [Rhodothermaceae bacterium]MYG45093.1 GWxTD domain-containing protein [Rhodothermaceae bacterium]